MPSYCIVCNRDLGTDPYSEPPRCGLHAQLQRDENSAEVKEQQLKSRLPTLDTCALKIEWVNPDRDDEPSAHSSGFICVDRVTPTASHPPKERFLVEPFGYLRKWHRTDSELDPGRFLVEPLSLMDTLRRIHTSLVDSGWRPVKHT